MIITTNKSSQYGGRRFRLAPVMLETFRGNFDLDAVIMKSEKKPVAAQPCEPYSMGRFYAEIGDYLSNVTTGQWSWSIAEGYGFKE